MPIDSIGRCDNNAPWPQHFCSDLHEQLQSPLQPSAQQPRCDDSKGEALRRYRFYLAFENTNEEGYVTEKVYDALDAGTYQFIINVTQLQFRCQCWQQW